jgi:hypothetical protein
MAVHIDIDLSLDARIGIALVQGTRRQAGPQEIRLARSRGRDRSRTGQRRGRIRDTGNCHSDEQGRAPDVLPNATRHDPPINTNVTFHFSHYGILLGHASDIAA